MRDPNKSMVRNVKVIKVIEVVSVIGNGTKESMTRYLNNYYSLNGQLLASHDTLEDAEKEDQFFLSCCLVFKGRKDDSNERTN